MKSKFIVKNQYREELVDEEPIFVTEGNLRVDSNGNKISEFCNKCSREDNQGLKVPGSCESRGCLGSSRRRPSTFGGGGNENGDQPPLSGSLLQDLDIENHCHGLEPNRCSSAKARNQLALATILCALFVTGEIIGGYLSGSLAIVGDAAHMFGDLASFGLSLLVLYISDRKSTKRMTYGYHRVEALGALATLCITWYVTGILVYLAVRRIVDQDFEIHDTTMLVTASAAVAFNILLGLTLHGACGLGHGHSHGNGRGHSHSDQSSTTKHINIRAAFIHVLGDFLQSIGVLISSLLIKYFGPSFKVADPICTLIFAMIVVLTSLTVLRETLSILLEGSPTGIKYEDVHRDLSKIGDVMSVHSLHIWSLTADIPVLTVHLTTKSEESDHHAIRNEAIKTLQSKYQIWRTTIQIEPHHAKAAIFCDMCQAIA